MPDPVIPVSAASDGRRNLLAACLLILLMGCGDDDAVSPANPIFTTVALCTDFPDEAIARFEDLKLAAAIRIALSLGVQGDLTCGLVSGLTELDAFSWGIASLVGMQNLTSLTLLAIGNNSIVDAGPLSGLTRLTYLSFHNNSITDIDALSELTSLTHLGLFNNSIADITALGRLVHLRFLGLHNNYITDVGALSELTALTSLTLSSNPELSDVEPLLANPGLGAGDEVSLRFTSVSCADVAALEAKGVTVLADCS